METGGDLDHLVPGAAAPDMYRIEEIILFYIILFYFTPKGKFSFPKGVEG